MFYMFEQYWASVKFLIVRKIYLLNDTGAHNTDNFELNDSRFT